MKTLNKYAEWYDKIKPGYIGFTFTDDSFISKGIVWFTRSPKSIKTVNHTFIVNDRPCGLIEAHIDSGVIQDTYLKYMGDPHTHLFFRKPKNLHPELAERIISAAFLNVGAEYDSGLIAAHMASGSFIGRLIGKWMGDIPEWLISEILNQDDKWICSELVANALDTQLEYRDKGCLIQADHCLTPQELFDDDIIFEPFNLSA